MKKEVTPSHRGVCSNREVDYCEVTLCVMDGDVSGYSSWVDDN